jgi:hypothetical protein
MPHISTYDIGLVGPCSQCGAERGGCCITKLGNLTNGYIHKARWNPHDGYVAYNYKKIMLPFTSDVERKHVPLQWYPLAVDFGWIRPTFMATKFEKRSGGGSIHRIKLECRREL